jgi:hypothetical protein
MSTAVLVYYRLPRQKGRNSFVLIKHLKNLGASKDENARALVANEWVGTTLVYGI